jgi:hypothetical protein
MVSGCFKRLAIFAIAARLQPALSHNPPPDIEMGCCTKRTDGFQICWWRWTGAPAVIGGMSICVFAQLSPTTRARTLMTISAINMARSAG